MPKRSAPRPLRRSERLRAAKEPKLVPTAATDSKGEHDYEQPATMELDWQKDGDSKCGEQPTAMDLDRKEDGDLTGCWSWNDQCDYVGYGTALRCLPLNVREITMAFAAHSEEEGKLERQGRLLKLQAEFRLPNLGYLASWNNRYAHMHIDSQLRILYLAGVLLRSWVSGREDGQQKLSDHLGTFPYVVISDYGDVPIVSSGGNLLLPVRCTPKQLGQFLESRSLRLAKRESQKNQNEGNLSSSGLGPKLTSLRIALKFRRIYVDDDFEDPQNVPWACQLLLNWYNRLRGDDGRPPLHVDGRLDGLRFAFIHLRWSGNTQKPYNEPVLLNDSRLVVWSSNSRLEDVISCLEANKERATKTYDQQEVLYHRLEVLKNTVFAECGRVWISRDHFDDKYRFGCDRIAKVVRFFERLLENSQLWNARIQWDYRWNLYVCTHLEDTSQTIYTTGQTLCVSHGMEIETLIKRIAADLVAPSFIKPKPPSPTPSAASTPPAAADATAAQSSPAAAAAVDGLGFQ